MSISFIIPAYNEEKTLAHVVAKIHDAFNDISYQIIIVDDGSTDATSEIAKHLSTPLVVYLRKTNGGKGSAIRYALPHATGDYIAIQDADLEYDPYTLRKLWDSVSKETPIIFGKRSRDKGYLLNRVANALLSFFCNILFNSRLFDIYTCYKILPRNIMQSLHLTASGFEIEAEITGALLRKKHTITEIPITYTPRTIREGKKIKAIDGIRGVLMLCVCRFFKHV